MAESTQATPAAATQPVIDRAYLEANHAELLLAFRAEGRAEGVTAERERILGIFALPAQGFEQLRGEMAADPAVTVGAAAQRILNAQAERVSGQRTAHLDALATDEQALQAPAASSAATADENSDEAVAARILSAGRALKAATAAS